MLVAVTRDGNVLFGTHQVQRSDLCIAIQDSLRHGSERKVYLKVDARVRYGDATSVIDQIRQATIQNVGIITAQREPTPR